MSFDIFCKKKLNVAIYWERNDVFQLAFFYLRLFNRIITFMFPQKPKIWILEHILGTIKPAGFRHDA